MIIPYLKFSNLKFSTLGICYLLFVPISVFKTLATSSYGGHFRFLGVPVVYIPLLLLGIYYFLRLPYLSRQLIPLIIFACLSLFNISYVRDYVQWFPYALMPFIYIIFTSGFSNLKLNDHNDFVLVFLIVFSLFPIISPFLFSLQLNQYYFAPLSSLGINRNHMSIAYSFFSVFSLAKLLVNRSYILPFIIFSLGVLLTWSRATYAYAISALIICLIISYQRGLLSFKFSKYIKKINVVAFCLFAIIALYLYFSGYVDLLFKRIGQFAEIPSFFNFSEVIDYELSGGRKQLLMRGSLAVFYENPVFGVGAGQSWLNLPDFVTSYEEGGSSHSLLLRILAEYGLVGFSAIVFFYINQSRILLLRLKNIPTHLMPLSIASTSLFIALPVISLGSEYPLTSVLFWYLYSLILSLSKNPKSSFSLNI